MNPLHNELDTELGLPSIRRKYKAGRPGKNINYGSVLKTSKRVSTKLELNPIVQEEKIIIKEESSSASKNRGIAALPLESSSSKITTTKTVIQGGNTSNKSQGQITITKTEIKESQNASSNARTNSRTIAEKGST